jgi:hypothetical protein
MPHHSRRACLNSIPPPCGSLLLGAAGGLRMPVHRSQKPPFLDSSGFGPKIESLLHPRGHRHRPDTSMLAAQIHDDPAPVALLDVING